MLTTGAGAIREPAARNLRPVALKVPKPSTDALAAARRKMLIELLTERIRMTSSVNVIVTSRARATQSLGIADKGAGVLDRGIGERVNRGVGGNQRH